MLLQASTAFTRTSMTPPLSSEKNFIDKGLRLVCAASGPHYVNAMELGTNLHVSRVHNIYYEHDFAEALVREMVLHHAHALDLK